MFVCTAEGTDTVPGFYTLSALAIDLGSLPEELSRKLPRHPVPCALIGRLAIDQSVRGHGLGRMLLADAIKRTMSASGILAIHAVIVDAKTNAAKQFYEGFGFAPHAGRPHAAFFTARLDPSLGPCFIQAQKTTALRPPHPKYAPHRSNPKLGSMIANECVSFPDASEKCAVVIVSRV